MTNNQPLILIIDDDLYFQDAWKKILENDVNIKTFSSPFDFEEAVDIDDMLLSSVCIIVDFDFGNENAGEIAIVDFLKAKNYIGKIFLCSVYEEFGEYDNSVRRDFDQIIKKTPLNWPELSKLIKEKKRIS